MSAHDVLSLIGRTPLVRLARLDRDLRNPNLDRAVIDEAITIPDEESFAVARRLITEEGLLVGGSAGTAVAAALRLAARDDLDGPIVTVLPDSWDRYFSKPWLHPPTAR